MPPVDIYTCSSCDNILYAFVTISSSNLVFNAQIASLVQKIVSDVLLKSSVCSAVKLLDLSRLIGMHSHLLAPCFLRDVRSMNEAR